MEPQGPSTKRPLLKLSRRDDSGVSALGHTPAARADSALQAPVADVGRGVHGVSAVSIKEVCNGDIGLRSPQHINKFLE